jgi:hypothetical protein
MARPVFVSYSQTDRECAFELVARLEAEGIGCWIAPRDVAPSAEWAAEIIDAISAARLMVLVFSVSSNDSPQVRREVERAVHKRLPVIPFRIDEVMPARSLEYFLSAQHWLDAFPPPREPYYDTLCQHLKRALDRGRAPPAPGLADAQASVQACVFSPADLQQIERRLAQFLGPVAALLVKRAAARASSIDDLKQRLAGELESEQERRQFLVR